MANMLMFETNRYAIKIDNFEGPLDLLCHLIDKNKMDIYDIKINEIADQYIEYLNQMEEMNLDIASEFIIMASTLIYLKSKSLLPKQEEAEEGRWHGGYRPTCRRGAGDDRRHELRRHPALSDGCVQEDDGGVQK